MKALFQPRRCALHTLTACALALAAPLAIAQAYPSKPVRFVVNFPAGGPTDMMARSVGEALQHTLKQPMVVENKGGAGGNIGTDTVAKSASDGYTVLFSIDTPFTVNPHLYPNLPYKPGDLKPLVVMASSGLLVGVNPGTKIASLGDLVKTAKTRSLNFGSAGSGSPGHLAVELFTEATNTRLNHIPYRGNTAAVTAILSGEVDGGVLATPGVLPHVQSGKVKGLAVTSRQRSRLLPDLPTVAELGHKNLEQEVLYFVAVPAATPEPVQKALTQAILEAVKRPDVQARMTQLDLFPEALSGEAAVQRVQGLYHRYGPIVKATGMKVE
jgi:tripartite-type tricarboxylate transporter receptor subunit TctC